MIDMLKVDIPYIFTFLIKTHVYLSGILFGVTPRTDTKRHVFKKTKIACSKYDNHDNPSKFNDQDNWGSI